MNWHVRTENWLKWRQNQTYVHHNIYRNSIEKSKSECKQKTSICTLVVFYPWECKKKWSKQPVNCWQRQKHQNWQPANEMLNLLLREDEGLYFTSRTRLCFMFLVLIEKTSHETVHLSQPFAFCGIQALSPLVPPEGVANRKSRCAVTTINYYCNIQIYKKPTPFWCTLSVHYSRSCSNAEADPFKTFRKAKNRRVQSD